MLRWFSATAAVLTIVALGFASPGCSDRSCIEWKSSEGACPAAADAAKFFGPCSNVQTIDSQGELTDNQFCCYDVTKTTRGLACKPLNDNTGGFSSRPSSFSSTGDVNEASSVVSSATSSSMAMSSTSDMSVGGSAPTSTTSMGGMGGTSGMGGMGGVGGTGGAGGMGGAPPSCNLLPCGYADGQPLSGCLACADHSMCASEADACSGDASCHDFESCLANCAITDHPCIDACASASPEGASIFADYIECEICVACATACAGAPVSGLTTCGMGGGGTGGAAN